MNSRCSAARWLDRRRLLVCCLVVCLSSSRPSPVATAGALARTSGGDLSLSQADSDVARSILSVRLAMGDVTECNLYMLGRISRILSQEANDLMNYQGWVFSQLNAMAMQLHNIFSDMEGLMTQPEGAERDVLEGCKTALSAAGLIPGFGAIALGANVAVQLGEVYAQWHNSEQAAGIAEGIKENARRQVEAFDGTVRIYNDIVDGLREIARYQARIQRLMDTYEERCLKRTGESAGGPYDYIPSPAGTPPDRVEDAVRDAVADLDDCDLPRLIALNKYLVAQISGLFDQQKQLFAELLTKSHELNAVMGNLEKGLPQPPNLGWEAIKLGIGCVGLSRSVNAQAASLGASVGSQVVDAQLRLDDVQAAESLKGPVRQKMQELKSILDRHQEVLTTLNRIRRDQQRIQRLIETWEDRCIKQDGVIGTIPGEGRGEGVRLDHDSPIWCVYTPGHPTSVPLPGEQPGGTTVPGGVPTPDGGEAPPGTPGAEQGPSSVPPTSCEQELETLRRFMDKHGDELRREINDPATSAEKRANIAHDLGEIKKRIAELEAECGPGTPSAPVGGPPSTPTAPVEPTPPSETPDVPTVTIYVKAKASVLGGEGDASAAITGQQVKFIVTAVADPALPGAGVPKPQTDHALGPIQGTTDPRGDLALNVPATELGLTPATLPLLARIQGPAFQAAINTTPQGSCNARMAGSDPQAAAAGLPPFLQPYLADAAAIGGTVFLTFMYPASMQDSMTRILVYVPGVVRVEINFCRDKQLELNDPHFVGKGAWKQAYDDQWAIKRVGLTAERGSAWDKLGRRPQPVTVAVIDTGLDWNHADLDWQNLWRNPQEIPDNGVDDDNNGYVDDIIGWDFMGKTNKPWDHDGHGTHVAGVIAATQNNEIGIAGINPYARVMVLKAINNFGHTRASYLARAIAYAADNGARVINLSVGGKHLTEIERVAVEYAASQGVLIVVASGNESTDVSDFGPAGIDSVLTVAATDFADKRAGFSNWGAQVDLAAPGLDVLGLRARRTDTMLDIPGVEYVGGANFVGPDNRYYRGSGTSFAAPLVTGVASLLFSKDPDLTGPQVAQILRQSAADVDVPGVDQHSGYGLVDAAAALDTSPKFFVEASISRVQVAQTDKGQVLEVYGTADADSFRRATLYIGAGEDPAKWQEVGRISRAVTEGLLGAIPAGQFGSAKVWIIRLVTEHRSRKERESRFRLATG